MNDSTTENSRARCAYCRKPGEALVRDPTNDTWLHAGCVELSRKADFVLAREQLAHKAMEPRDDTEATALIRGGLIRIDAGCRYFCTASVMLGARVDPKIAKEVFGTPGYDALRRLALYLFDMVKNNDRERFEQVQRMVRQLEGDSVPPLGATTTDPYVAARWLRRDLEHIRSGGFVAAIRAQVAASGQEIASLEREDLVPTTRWNVAAWIAATLRELDPEGSDSPKRQQAIYERMPLNGHGHSVDRAGKFKDAFFEEDPKRTVIAAFKAIGHKGADQLFKADSMKRSRATKKRQQAARGK